jgi:spore germination protein GerM
MTRTAAGLLILGLMVVALAFWLWPGQSGEERSRVVSGGPAVDSPEASEEPVTASVILYFLAPGDLLRAETRELSPPVPESPEDVARRALEELLKGSSDENLLAPLDSSVEVVSVVVNQEAVVYVDLQSVEDGSPPGSGSQVEILRVFSLVNTVLGNLTTAEAVVVLWNGTQLRSLSGHLDMGRPLRFRDSLVDISGRHDESG